MLDDDMDLLTSMHHFYSLLVIGLVAHRVWVP